MLSDSDNCYIIAEIGVNHNGSVQLGRDLIDAAAQAGADAVKFQTFRAEDLVTPAAEKAKYQAVNTENSDSQFSMLKALEFSADDFREMKQHCQKAGIAFLSTPFSEDAADLLDEIGVNAYKISSGDLTHLPMLRHIARKNKPVILSSGMGTLSDVEAALEAIAAEGNTQTSVLHCVSNYPAAAEDCNLAAIDTMRQAFGCTVGWSDHSIGHAISWAAVARGARIVEKHITLDKGMPGPDHKASMEPDEFTEFVLGIRSIEVAIGSGIKKPTEVELVTAKVGRRSLVAARPISMGSQIQPGDLKIVRPGTGLRPGLLDFVLGCTARRDVAENTPLTAEDLHGD